ncbi:MauE/DoxX family redox-associated membrane protein [Actinomyces qiguomingii]|uniref:MauE/DoxX family redox-associated membrane protein n=1 Tax=Actinomyces qiguomingii TaxID=2057800 RepID=UPI000CA07A96
MHTLVVVGRVVVGLVFVAFGVMKWRAGVSHGARVVRGFDLVPERFVSAVAVLLPPVEILLGILLFAGVVPVFAAVASCLLLLVFAVR